MKKFISEDDLDSFGGFLEYQGIDRSSVSTAELAEWRDIFNESRATKLASARVGAMKLTKIEGMYQYAVAVREDSKLFLTLWVRRNKKFEFFVMIPRSDREWDPHISYHRDGRLHSKSFGEKNLIQERQPLTASFRGSEPLGSFSGYGPKSVGADCNLSAFDGVAEVPTGVLGPRHGSILVDLVEPGCPPTAAFKNVVCYEVFSDFTPWLVIRVCS